MAETDRKELDELHRFYLGFHASVVENAPSSATIPYRSSSETREGIYGQFIYTFGGCCITRCTFPGWRSLRHGSIVMDVRPVHKISIS